MMTEKLGHGFALALMFCLVAVLATACGGSGGGTATVTGSGAETGATTEEEAGSAETTAGEESGGGASEALAGLSTPPGSELLSSKEGANVVYEHYKTSTEPKAVQSFYKEQMSSAGWSIESSGGGGGGWGSYGGSDYGLTAKREDDYFDLEAGGEKNSTSYFEVCPAPAPAPNAKNRARRRTNPPPAAAAAPKNRNPSPGAAEAPSAWDLRFRAMGTRADLLGEGEPELLAPAARWSWSLRRPSS